MFDRFAAIVSRHWVWALLVILQLSSELMAVDNMPLMAGIYQTLDQVRADGRVPEGL